MRRYAFVNVIVGFIVTDKEEFPMTGPGEKFKLCSGPRKVFLFKWTFYPCSISQSMSCRSYATTKSFSFVICCHLISYLRCIEFNQILPNQYFASSASATSSWQCYFSGIRSHFLSFDIHVASRHIVINLSHPLKMWCLDGCNDWLANKVLSDVFITSVLSGYLLWMPNMLYQTTPPTSSMRFNSEWTEINTENAFFFLKILLVALRWHSGEKDTDQVFLINFRKTTSH